MVCQIKTWTISKRGFGGFRRTSVLSWTMCELLYFVGFHIVVCGLDSIVARRWINGMLVSVVYICNDFIVSSLCNRQSIVKDVLPSLSLHLCQPLLNMIATKLLYVLVSSLEHLSPEESMSPIDRFGIILGLTVYMRSGRLGRTKHNVFPQNYVQGNHCFIMTSFRRHICPPKTAVPQLCRNSQLI